MKNEDLVIFENFMTLDLQKDEKIWKYLKKNFFSKQPEES